VLILVERLEGDRGQGGEVRPFAGVHEAPTSARAFGFASEILELLGQLFHLFGRESVVD